MVHAYIAVGTWWRIVCASENFWVIALGLPVPPYRGNIHPASFQEQLEELKRRCTALMYMRKGELRIYMYCYHLVLLYRPTDIPAKLL